MSQKRDESHDCQLNSIWYWPGRCMFPEIPPSLPGPYCSVIDCKWHHQCKSAVPISQRILATFNIPLCFMPIISILQLGKIQIFEECRLAPLIQLICCTLANYVRLSSQETLMCLWHNQGNQSSYNHSVETIQTGYWDKILFYKISSSLSACCSCRSRTDMVMKALIKDVDPFLMIYWPL